MREIMLVNQPCILCEGTLERWHVMRDEATGEERIDKEQVDHICTPMSRLLAERTKGTR